MKKNQFKSLFIALLVLLFALSGCDMGEGGDGIAAPTIPTGVTGAADKENAEKVLATFGEDNLFSSINSQANALVAASANGKANYNNLTGSNQNLRVNASHNEGLLVSSGFESIFNDMTNFAENLDPAILEANPEEYDTWIEKITSARLKSSDYIRLSVNNDSTIRLTQPMSGLATGSNWKQNDSLSFELKVKEAGTINSAKVQIIASGVSSGRGAFTFVDGQGVRVVYDYTVSIKVSTKEFSLDDIGDIIVGMFEDIDFDAIDIENPDFGNTFDDFLTIETAYSGSLKVYGADSALLINNSISNDNTAYIQDLLGISIGNGYDSIFGSNLFGDLNDLFNGLGDIDFGDDFYFGDDDFDIDFGDDDDYGL